MCVRHCFSSLKGTRRTKKNFTIVLVYNHMNYTKPEDMITCACFVLLWCLYSYPIWTNLLPNPTNGANGECFPCMCVCLVLCNCQSLLYPDIWTMVVSPAWMLNISLMASVRRLRGSTDKYQWASHHCSMSTALVYAHLVSMSMSNQY